MPRTFGAIISQLRKIANETQEELAQALCVSPQAISKWENNINMPDSAILPLIANHFNVSIDYLFGIDKTKLTVPESVFNYISALNTAESFEHAFSIYRELHDALWGGSLSREQLEQQRVTDYSNPIPSYAFFPEGLSLYLANGYGNLITREFWESVSFTTASFSREVLSEFSQPGTLEILLILISRPYEDLISFSKLTRRMISIGFTESAVKERLDSMIDLKIVAKNFRELPDHSVETTYCIPHNYYFAFCSLVAALHVLEVAQKGAVYGNFTYGGYPVKIE